MVGRKNKQMMETSRLVELEETLKEAKKTKRFLVTVTYLQTTMEKGNLYHFGFMNDFPIDDIVPSLEECKKSLLDSLIKKNIYEVKSSKKEN